MIRNQIEKKTIKEVAHILQTSFSYSKEKALAEAENVWQGTTLWNTIFELNERLAESEKLLLSLTKHNLEGASLLSEASAYLRKHKGIKI